MVTCPASQETASVEVIIKNNDKIYIAPLQNFGSAGIESVRRDKSGLIETKCRSTEIRITVFDIRQQMKSPIILYS